MTKETKKIWIIEDDPIMASCLARAAKTVNEATTQTFGDIISAVSTLDKGLPDLILLDVLLNGPDGFTLLNELGSYSDTASIPVIIVTSLNLPAQDLSHYGVIKILNKDTMLPQDVADTVKRALFQEQVELLAAQGSNSELKNAA